MLHSAGYRSGVVALVGPPNVGKSSLLNHLVGRRVAITAAVPHTTRTRLQGILTRPDAQLIFIDTPAIHHARHRLGERMVAQAREALTDADVILAVFDASRPLTDEDRTAGALVARAGKPAVAALNKADRASGADISARRDEIAALAPFRAIVPVSAATNQGLDTLVGVLLELLPEGPQYFPPETVTGQNEQGQVRELIREQVLRLTREELPHSVAVEIEEFTERAKDLIYVRAILHVERESHKKMLIGREGRMLKEIGRRARAEIEARLGRRVYLDLWVKTSKDWRERDDLIRKFYPEHT